MCKIPAHSLSPWCNDRHRILSPKGQPACLLLSLRPRAHHKPWDDTLLLWDCDPGTLLAAPFPQYHMAPAAPSPGAAPGAASRPSSSHVMLLIQSILLHIPEVSQDSSASMQSLLCDLNQVRQFQHTLPKPIWQWRQAVGTVAPPVSKWEQSLQKQNRLQLGEAKGRRKETHNPSKVQICSERSLPSLQPKGKQIPNICHL